MYDKSGQVDWITATSTSEKRGMNWLEVFNNHRDGNRAKQVKMHGFVGLQYEGLIWATRTKDQRYMMIASGSEADLLWRKVGIFADRVTRLDLAVDVWLKDEAKPDQVKWAGRPLVSAHWDATPYKHTLFTSSKGGQTLYVGSRQSQTMGRFYDKGVQSGLAEPGRWYRYEVEIKKPLSGKVFNDVNEMYHDGALHGFIVEFVFDFFYFRWVMPLFDTRPHASHHIRSLARASTDKDKKLSWLRTQVAPTVAYLFEAGLGESCIEALGLNIGQDQERMVQLSEAAHEATKNKADPAERGPRAEQTKQEVLL